MKREAILAAVLLSLLYVTVMWAPASDVQAEQSAAVATAPQIHG
jgi:hypothetical protein